MDITNAPYSLEDYVYGYFDCSNMASLMDKYLEEKGYDSKVMVYPVEPNNSHTFLLINNKTLVDPVTKKIIKNKTPQDFPGAIIFNDPEMLQAYLEPENWNKEWSVRRGILHMPKEGTLQRAPTIIGIGKGIIFAGALCLFAYFFAVAITDG